MAVALAYPNGNQGKRNDLTSFLKKEVDDDDKPSAGHISKARYVLRNCRDKAEEVLRNPHYPLTKAYEEAQAIVEQQRIEEEERKERLRKLAALRDEYPDLAALVDDQRLGLPEAIAAGDKRRQEAEEKARREREEEARA